LANLNQESQEFRDEIERDLIYLSTFALDDHLRDGVVKSIQNVKYGRLVDSNEGTS
jgi:magnesium-transporting ATPase (P-type)